MKLLKLCLLLCVIVPLQLLAQSGRYETSARNTAIGGASATIADQYSAFYNVAGLAQYNEGLTALAGYQHRFGLAELASMGFGLVMPQQFGTIAIITNRFGFGDYYNEQRAGVGIANKIGFVSLGANVSYVQYSIETVGTRSMLSVDFGGIVEVSEKLHFGSYIRNVNQARIQEFTDERLPTLLVLGISYRHSNALMLNGEIEKDLEYREVLKFGIEYKATEAVLLRTGLRTAPFEGAFGLGFKPKKFQIDYAYLTTSRLGDRHELSLSYLIKSK